MVKTAENCSRTDNTPCFKIQSRKKGNGKTWTELEENEKIECKHSSIFESEKLEGDRILHGSCIFFFLNFFCVLLCVNLITECVAWKLTNLFIGIQLCGNRDFLFGVFFFVLSPFTEMLSKSNLIDHNIYCGLKI